jgi:receptor expression-enhancing protein 5/6
MAELVQSHLNFLRQTALDLPSGQDLVEVVESNTKLTVEHVLCAIEVLMVTLLFCGIGASFITNLVGFLFPAIMTVLAIESEKKDDDTQWLIYWVVFATFHMIEPLVQAVVIYWVPFFYPLKVSFLLWMMLPQTKGANVVFNLVLPYFGTITRTVNHVDTELRSLGKSSNKVK